MALYSTRQLGKTILTLTVTERRRTYLKIKKALLQVERLKALVYVQTSRVGGHSTVGRQVT